jgi:hypothetical protein
MVGLLAVRWAALTAVLKAALRVGSMVERRVGLKVL